MPTMSDEWVVEKVLQWKKFRQKDHYLVKWEGYGDDRNTWEFWESLGGAVQRGAWHVQLQALGKLPDSDPSVRRAAIQDKRCDPGPNCEVCMAFATRVD